MSFQEQKKPELEIVNLVKSFENKKILQGINLSLECGQALGVIGLSGTGKSVLLKCIMGLLPIDQGKILLRGEILNSALRKKFYAMSGMLFQGSALFDSLTVWENISFALTNKNFGISNSDAYQVALKKLEEVGLSKSVAKLMPSELSGGMQKRVAIARAIAGEPKFLFFDEPTSGLDPITASTINLLISDIVNRGDITSITITHDLNSIEEICSHVILLDKGVISWSGEKAEMPKSSNLMIQKFIGDKLA